LNRLWRNQRDASNSLSIFKQKTQAAFNERFKDISSIKFFEKKRLRDLDILKDQQRKKKSGIGMRVDTKQDRSIVKSGICRLENPDKSFKYFSQYLSRMKKFF